MEAGRKITSSRVHERIGLATAQQFVQRSAYVFITGAWSRVSCSGQGDRQAMSRRHRRRVDLTSGSPLRAHHARAGQARIVCSRMRCGAVCPFGAITGGAL